MLLSYPTEFEKKVLSQTDGHYCLDWDMLPVSARTFEYDCCACYPKTLRGRILNWLVMIRFNWRARKAYANDAAER